MNGPYHPRSTLSPIDLKIKRLQTKLQVIKNKERDPNWQKKRNEAERLRRKKKREEDPAYKEKINTQAREYYKKNPQKQIDATLKWNKANKDRKNATNRRSYQKNKEKICAKNKEKRRLKREAKQ